MAAVADAEGALVAGAVVVEVGVASVVALDGPAPDPSNPAPGVAGTSVDSAAPAVEEEVGVVAAGLKEAAWTPAATPISYLPPSNA